MIATLVDHLLFLLLLSVGVIPGVSNLISQFTAILTNFFLQKQYIFRRKRKTVIVFVYSLAFSSVGLLLASILIQLLVNIPALTSYPYLAKVLVTGLLFFYNYYAKRFAFEKR